MNVMVKRILMALVFALAMSHAVCSFTECARSESPQKLVVFFDGTWNETGTNTNVERLHAAVVEQQKSASGIQMFYDRGIGSDWRKLSGGLTGYGFSRNVREGYTFVAERYRPGDQIYIFGFSRGAFTARTLAAMIQKVGILNPEVHVREGRSTDGSAFRNDVEELFKITKDFGKKTYFQRTGARKWTLNDLWRWSDPTDALEALRRKRARQHPNVVVLHPPSIEVVGVWDTVGALGLNHDVGEVKYLVMLNDLPDVRRAYQALAIDETRPSFRPVTWHETGEVKSDQVLDEVWFPGAHSDVGGGYEPASAAFGTANLADLPLSWMVSKLRSDGLVQDEFAQLSTEQCTALTKAKRHIAEQSFTSKTFVRMPRSDAAIHVSVCERMAAPEDSVEGKQPTGLYRPANLLIDGSMLRPKLRIVDSVDSMTCGVPVDY